MVIAADYPFLDILWTMLIFFAWVIWFTLLFRIFGDLFRRHDLSGWGKTGWFILVIFLPFLGVFIYLISQGQRMAERDAERAKAAQADMADYVRSVVGLRRRGRGDRQGPRPAPERRDQPGRVRRHQGQGAGVAGSHETLALIGVAIAGLLPVACGESDEDKAKSQVCDARADIQKQVDELSGLTITTASVDQVQQSLKAIGTTSRTWPTPKVTSLPTGSSRSRRPPRSSERR